MRRVRMLSILIFVVALVVFWFGKLHELANADFAGPKIEMTETTIIVSAKASEESLLAGVSAVDLKDGDVTGSLVVEGKGNFIEKGRREITIAAFDSDHHVTKATREVVYNDYHSPVFSLNAPLKFSVGVQNILGGISAQDVLDGNLTENIKVSSEYKLDVTTPGIYPMMFTVSNSAGDVVDLPVNVEIFDPNEETLKPQIMLTQYLVYTAPGVPVNPWEYVRSITMDGNEYIRSDDGVFRDMQPEEEQERTEIRPEEVAVIQNFDYGMPGVYELVYQVSGANGIVGAATLIVVVSE